MVLCDKNPTNSDFVKNLELRNLKTDPICVFCNGTKIENIYTISRLINVDNELKNHASHDNNECNLLGLLLQGNTTFFELTTIPSIDQFYPIDDQSYKNTLIVSYKLANGFQGINSINKLFLKHKSIDTTIIVTDETCNLISCVNVELHIRRSYNSIEFTSRQADIQVSEISYILDNRFEKMTIFQLLSKFDASHRFYITMGENVNGFKHLIKLNNLVIDSASAYYWLKPAYIGIETIRHVIDENTETDENITNVLRPIIDNIKNETDAFYKNRISVANDKKIMKALKEYTPATIDKLYKYTIKYSLIQLINILVEDNVHKSIIIRFIEDETAYEYANANLVNGEKMHKLVYYDIVAIDNPGYDKMLAFNV